MANEPAYDATYALVQLLRTQALTGGPRHDATTAFAKAITAAPTLGVQAPAVITGVNGREQTPTHTYRVESAQAPKDTKEKKK